MPLSYAVPQPYQPETYGPGLVLKPSGRMTAPAIGLPAPSTTRSRAIGCVGQERIIHSRKAAMQRSAIGTINLVALLFMEGWDRFWNPTLKCQKNLK